MPRNLKHKNIIQIFRKLISDHLESDILLIRRIWIETARYYGLSETYADSFRRSLTILGYIEETNETGVYRCVKKIPFGKMYKDFRDEVKEYHQREREKIERERIINT